MTPAATSSMSALVARVFWMMFGPLFLLLLAANIVSKGNGWLTTTDFVFAVVLAGVIVARWYEFYKGDPKTSTGEPATPRHLRRYVSTILPVGLGIWVIANVIGNHLIGR